MYLPICLAINSSICLAIHLPACLSVCLPCLSVGFTHGALWTAHGYRGYCDACTLLVVFHSYAGTLNTEQHPLPFVPLSNPELNTASSEMLCVAGRQGEGSWPCCEPADGTQHEGWHDQIPGHLSFSTSTALPCTSITLRLHCTAPTPHYTALHCTALHCRILVRSRA